LFFFEKKKKEEKFSSEISLTKQQKKENQIYRSRWDYFFSLDNLCNPYRCKRDVLFLSLFDFFAPV